VDGLKFGYVLPNYPFELICENAVLAESSGYDSIWMTDHMVGVGIKRFHSLEAWSTLARLSAETKRVTMGVCVSDPHRRHPAVLAQMGTTLDIMSGGRVVLGLGAGEAMNLDPYGIAWSRPVSKTSEAITVIKKLWTEDSVNYTGEFFKLSEAFLSPKPLQKPHPPIWVGANSPRSMKMTAELADGWIPTCVLTMPRIYQEKLSKIQAWAKDAGREPLQIEPAIHLFTAAAQDQETARKLVEFPAKILLLHTVSMLRLGKEVLKDYGVELPDELDLSRFVFNPKTVQNLLKGVEKVPFKAVEDIFVFGTPDDCIGKIEKYVKAGARHFLLSMFAPPELSKSMIQLYANKVMSYFRSERKE
jgi:alkanesulfonate monooxygenase SsuD/methylene tetrahydromethanopterin reductase-like flavin-dependent oxidoreductase (luciferase family)